MHSETPSSSRVVLASRSPRRRQIVRAIDLPMECVDPQGEEGPPLTSETPLEFALRVSLAKARSAANRDSDAIFLAADTSVILDGEVLGKPSDSSEAVRMLKRLQGLVHTVATGITVLDGRSGRWRSATKTTDVTMRRYSDIEVAAYVDSGEPLDKAGGYAIQDETFQPAQAWVGCYLNVVGLPLCEVIGLLEGFGIDVRLKAGWQPPEQCRDCPLEQRLEVNRR